MEVIQARNLTKVYRKPQKTSGLGGAIRGLFSRSTETFTAVDQVDLSVHRGEIVGFLGPNGAGKTTTLKMLSGILHPTHGEAKVLGFRPFDRNHEMLRRMSLVMGNKQQLWWDLPARESFSVLAAVYEVPPAKFKQRLDHLVESLDLTEKLDTQVRRLSLGERMKCELVAAMLHRPEVIFLDEPTIGLDLVSQARIRSFLKQVNQEEQCTIMLTSHYMQDVQELCRRIVIIDHGKVKFDDDIDRLKGQFQDRRVLHLYLKEKVAADQLEDVGHVVKAGDFEASIEIPATDVASATSRALQSLPVADLAVENVSIERVIHDLFSRK